MKGLVGLVLMAAVAYASQASADTLVTQFSGQNISTTRPFEVTGPWEIQWQANGDLFQIYVHRVDGNLAGIAANQMGGGSGSSFQPMPGRYYLNMNAIGSWHVRVVRVD